MGRREQGIGKGSVLGMGSAAQRQHGSKGRREPLWVLAVCCVLAAPPARADDAPLKAAFVFNFLKFTDWPALPAGNGLTLCLSNADRTLEVAFASINGRVANGRAVRVQVLRPGDPTAACDVLYVRYGGRPLDLQPLAASQPGLLTVGDAENFIEDGGVIGLVEREGQLRFAINLDVARRSQYRISSQLLKLAFYLQGDKK